MRFLRFFMSIRQRGFGSFAGLFLIISYLLIPQCAQAAAHDHVKILYYFSMTCRHCLDAKPAVLNLSRKYAVEGQNVGDIPAQGYPFSVKAADKKQSKDVYKVAGVPTLVVFIDDVLRLNIAGSQDIGDAEVIIRALDRGAMTVTEAAEKTSEGEITVVGWVSAQGEYFRNARFFITDRKTDLQIKPWLPLEAMKSMAPNSKRPRLMSDIIRRPVLLKGSVTKTSAGKIFTVKEELHID